MAEDEVVSPYIDTTQFADIPIYPFQLNNDLYIHLKKNLKDAFLGKCNKYGYVQHIYKIKNYEEGKSNPSNTSGSVVFQVTYECSLCNPGIGDKIVGEIASITKPFIIATNGPIKICIPVPKNINTSNFFVDNNGTLRYKTSDEKKSLIVKKKDFVICKIINKDLFVNNNEIMTIGVIERIASEEETKKFFDDANKFNKKKKKTEEEMVSNELINEESVETKEADVREQQEETSEQEEPIKKKKKPKKK
jgi:DNA-directed RNA polymerase subunit E'/Rpb7